MDDGYYTLIYAIVQCVLGVVTILGNMLVIASVYSVPKIERGLHKHGKASLAAADLLTGELPNYISPNFIQQSWIWTQKSVLARRPGGEVLNRILYEWQLGN